MNLGAGEIVLILVVIMFFFGSKKIPELARGLGKGMREFKDAANGIQRELTQEVNDLSNEARSVKEETLNIREEVNKNLN